MYLLKDRQLQLIKELYDEFPEYVEGTRYDGDYHRTSEHTGISFVSTDKFIYACVNRHKESDMGMNTTYNGYPYYYQDRIDVYTWSGDYVHSFHTDIPFMRYAVSDSDNYLFILTIDVDSGEPLLIRYALPSI